MLPNAHVLWMLAVIVVTSASQASAAKRCQDPNQLRQTAAAVTVRNRARLTKHLEHRGYAVIDLPAIRAPGNAVLPGAQTSSVTIQGESVAVYATRSAVLGAGQSVEVPMFVKDEAGGIFVVEWSPKKQYELRARACSCVMNGGGAPRREQHVYRLPRGHTTVKRMKVTAPAAEVLRAIGPVCLIPRARSR